MTKFEIGEEITLTTRGSRATVEYGPFDDRDVYVVRLVDAPADPNDVRTFTALSCAMRRVPAFSVGDKVTSTVSFRGEVGTLAAGPFVSRFSGVPFWVMECDGKHATPRESTLTKVTDLEPIKVGDRVRVTDDDGGGRNRFNGRIGTVKELHGSDFLPYLVEFGDGRGRHGDLSGRWHCKAVERVEDENTYTHDGVTYDLSALYRDRDGDVWRLKRVGTAVRARTDGDTPTGDSLSLPHVADHWGPLTRVTT
ncbi:phiSA1p31-related protein [Streptomyces sp. NBC_00076]|uniref:phiSA1p31-related protein n=1 Tax=Streptomyces sp. NBC_00076 TaxID=2975642 RepID=UPI0032554318